MATTSKTSRAAATAGPGEILVPVLGELIPYPDRQGDYDAFRSINGRPVATWSATKQAGAVLASVVGLNAVEMWAVVDGGAPYAVLARFTRKSRGTVAHAEIVGAARTALPPDTDESTEPDQG